MQLATHMNQKFRRIRGKVKRTSSRTLREFFAEATITGRNSQDSDSAAESDNDDNTDDR